MNYSAIIKNDFTAAPGVSLTLFVSGCSNYCPGCHNPELWDPNAGLFFTDEAINEILEGLTANGITRTFCIMGGDPLYDKNIETIASLIMLIKTLKQTNVWLWTGYTYEQLQKHDSPWVAFILEHIDVLVDGPFIQEQRDVTLPYRGSRNQRVIDMKKTLEQGEVILWEN